jgi:serine-type D-Ala-D-Ala carboxypeptidase/endopeptidase (penicillin-binding protein 4)
MRVGRFVAMACAFAVMVVTAPEVALAKPPRAKAKPKALTKDGGKRAARLQNVAPRGETASERQLQDDLDAVLGERTLAGTRSGVYAVDMNTGKVLYSYGADEQLNPASNVKLVTTAAALDALGPDFAYRTRIVGAKPDANGVVQGDVWLVGMADPTLSEKDLAELGTNLHMHGVTRVTGQVLVTSTADRDVLGRPRLEVSVEAGADEGQLPTVRVSPDSAYVEIENRAVVDENAKVARTCRTRRIGKGKTRRREKICGPVRPVQLDVAMRSVEDGPGGPHVVISVSGKLRPGTRYSMSRYAPHPQIFTAHTMRANMKRSGIQVDGGVRVVEGKPGAELADLAVHDSMPLGELVARVNKPSNNFLADRVAELTGRQVLGEATVGGGVKVMNDYMSKLGISPGSFLLENGSGLSYKSHLSVRQIAGVLMAGLKDDRIGNTFFASMSIAGKDGTLRGRFNGRESKGFVFGKTGTLNGVAALSGYVTIDGGEHVICFAIVTNGFRNPRKPSVRASQARIVDAMYRHLRRQEAERDAKRGIAAPPPATIVPPEVEDPTVEENDVEGEDSDEGEMDPMPVPPHAVAPPTPFVEP